MKNQNIVEIFALFLILVIALSLTPTIASQAVQAEYSSITQVDLMNGGTACGAGTANTTTLGYTAENYSTPALNDAVWSITLNSTNAAGNTKITFVSGNVSLTALTTLTFYNVTAGKSYSATTIYNALTTSAAVQALVTLVPLFWVLLMCAITIVITYAEFKRMHK